MTGFYKVAIGVMRVVMPLWFKIDTEGLENLPGEGGYLFVSNHRSNADPILIGIQNPETQFCFLAKQELFADGLVGWLLKKLGAVAVDRGAGDITPLEEIAFRLENGENALIFPEGTRSKDGKLGRFKTGAALIAGQTGVPVVPVAISFDDELHFRSTIHIRYGKPFDVPQTSADDPSVSVLKEIRQAMTKHVAALLEGSDPPAQLEMKAKPAGRKAQPEKEKEHDAEQQTAEQDSAAQPNRMNKKNTEDTIETMAKNNKQNANRSADDAARKKAAERLEDAAEDAVSEVEDIISDAEESVSRKKRMREPEDEIVSASPFKIKNPFKKLLKAIDSEDEFAAIEDELTQDEEPPQKPAKKADDEEAPVKKKKPQSDESEADDRLPMKKKPAADDADLDDADDARLPMKKKKPAADDADFDGADDARLPMPGKGKKKKPVFDDEPEYADDADPVYDDELYDDEEDSRKGGLFGGLKKKFRKDDDFDYDDDYDDDDYDDDYDDDEYEEGGRRFDYGRIALILTFVILGIFAFDFCRRLYNDWKNSQGMLDIQSQASSNVESMDGESSEATATMTAITSTDKPVSGTTLASTTMTTVSLLDASSTTSSTSQVIDTRETQTISVDNNLVHSGSLVLINGDHQQAANPNLITLAEIPYQHLRVVSTLMQVDKSLSEPIVSMFNDFFTNTGLGNIMVYSTTEQSGNQPYNISIPERATGLCLDLAILNEAQASHSPYTADGNYAWLAEHCADYGFIQRYPADKAEQTGLNGISWHFRYVGAPHAKYMADNKLCLEEYLELIANHPWDSEHLTTTVNSVVYEMYYVPASDTEASTTIKYPLNANGATPMISGDNVDGFIVAIPKQ